MPVGAFTEGEEKLLLLLMLGQETTISRAQAADIGERMGRSGDVVRYEFFSVASELCALIAACYKRCQHRFPLSCLVAFSVRTLP
jgi:hypothetical protein